MEEMLNNKKILNFSSFKSERYLEQFYVLFFSKSFIFQEIGKDFIVEVQSTKINGNDSIIIIKDKKEPHTTIIYKERRYSLDSFCKTIKHKLISFNNKKPTFNLEEILSFYDNSCEEYLFITLETNIDKENLNNVDNELLKQYENFSIYNYFYKFFNKSEKIIQKINIPVSVIESIQIKKNYIDIMNYIINIDNFFNSLNVPNNYNVKIEKKNNKFNNYNDAIGSSLTLFNNNNKLFLKFTIEKIEVGEICKIILDKECMGIKSHNCKMIWNIIPITENDSLLSAESIINSTVNYSYIKAAKIFAKLSLENFKKNLQNFPIVIKSN
jgi:hypothetical protein